LKGKFCYKYQASPLLSK